jgi:hypothetical protein
MSARGGNPKLLQFKLVLLGESAVGKSSLVLRFVKGQFNEYQESTIGAAFLTQTVVLDDVTVKFEIWDTAGQERYHSLAPMYVTLTTLPPLEPKSRSRLPTTVVALTQPVSRNIAAAFGTLPMFLEQAWLTLMLRQSLPLQVLPWRSGGSRCLRRLQLCMCERKNIPWGKVSHCQYMAQFA